MDSPVVPSAPDNSTDSIPNLISCESSSDDCDPHRAVNMTDISAKATVDHRAAKHVPILTEGILDPSILMTYESAVLDHFEDKQYAPEDRVRKILGGLQGVQVREWFTADRARIQALTFEEFMAEFRAEFLESDWEDTAEEELLSMVQGDETFTIFARRLEIANTKLVGTSVHLTKDRLRQQLTVGMSSALRLRVKRAGVNDQKDYKLWKEAVRHCEDLLLASHAEFQEFMKKSRTSSRSNAVLGEPSRKANTFTSASQPNAATGPSSKKKSKDDEQRPPAITAKEKEILLKYRGCFKCRRLDQTHVSRFCPNGFPAAVGYREITMADVPAGCKAEPERKTVAAVVPDARAPSPSPVRGRRVSSSYPQPRSFSESPSPSNRSQHVVAAVLGSSRNPAAYTTPPRNRVMDGSSSDDRSRSRTVSNIVAAVVTELDPVSVPSVGHLWWKAASVPEGDTDAISVRAMLDCGSHLDLVSPKLVERLKLAPVALSRSEEVSVAIGGKKTDVSFSHMVTFRLSDPSFMYTSRTISACIAPQLSMDLLLGMPFLSRNDIILSCKQRTATCNKSGFDLLHPTPRPDTTRDNTAHGPANRRREAAAKLAADRKALLKELKSLPLKQAHGKRPHLSIGAVRERIEILAAQDALNKLGDKVKEKYKDVFTDVAHLDDLPKDVYCRIKLRDAEKQITTRSYSTPRKYREAWGILIQQHLDTGRIRPSNSQHASPAFIIPKADVTVLPRWVNDYRQLNANTIPDSYPLPRIDDIMADAVKGKIWSILDMTNSFFQTRVHPDDVHLTAVTTPFGLYEWLAMPMGLRNAPAIHQRRMISALRKYIGKICHIYLDDIIIWSNTIEEHTEHIRLIMEALREASLHCNPKKCHFYQLEVNFLGHHISERGAEASESKVARILEWPVPKSATDVRAFLGLVRYIAVYLKSLAEFTRVLTPLTTKDATKHFPGWNDDHQIAFDAIKKLVTSRECIISIDHENPGKNNIYVTCDASEWRSGAVLSFGETWESARPVAFESAQFGGAELNYPVHEKELLAIVRALKKWRSDLLGTHIYVYTDHKTLENFNTQKDLSRRQLRWQELMAQFDMTIVYIRGEDNTVADALSRVPINGFPTENAELLTKGDIWSIDNHVGAVLSVATDLSVLNAIRDGYKDDEFVQRLLKSGIQGVTMSNGLVYTGTRLVIPKVTDVRENLFQLAHDALGHFGSDKSYAALRDCYYWPGMRKDLEQGYIPGCVECQRNKSRTTKPAGPLHPLPIPEQRCDSVAIDFVGPLPLDEGFDTICTMTCRLNSEFKIVPVRSNITAGEFAVVFFDTWYCEHGLPLEIVSDRDKLFVSKLWRALLKLTGIRMKMSSSFHPETDGASERTNKTVNQAVRYHVERNQKGWVRALPKIRFDMMNTVNASTGFSGFQLKLGRSPRLIPPLMPSELPPDLVNSSEAAVAEAVIRQVSKDVADARDNMLAAKVAQTHSANASRGTEVTYKVGDKVMLSTYNRRRDYKRKGQKRAAKFMPRWDGPYVVEKAHAEPSNYSLVMPNSAGTFATFHASQLKAHCPNDDVLFPARAYAAPGPVVTTEGMEEFHIDKIIDAKRIGRGWCYLVRWVGYGPEEDRWLPGREVANCEALDVWLAENPNDI